MDDHAAISAGAPDVALPVRPAVAEDGGTMNELAQVAYRPYVHRIGRLPAPMSVDYCGVAGGGTHGWASSTGAWSGSWCSSRARTTCSWRNLAVDPDRQGTGVGGRLLALAGEQAGLIGLAEVRLFTSAAMTQDLEYYPCRGYRRTLRAEQDGYQGCSSTSASATVDSLVALGCCRLTRSRHDGTAPASRGGVARKR